MPVIDRVLVGESLVIEDGDLDNVAHIDLIMGPRGSAAEDAFCRTLTDQKQGVNGLLAVVAPNLMVKPATVMFNKVTIKNMKQAVQMFGPALLLNVLKMALSQLVKLMIALSALAYSFLQLLIAMKKSKIGTIALLKKLSNVLLLVSQKRLTLLHNTNLANTHLVLSKI